MYTSYEKGVIEDLADMFPDIAGELQAIINRLVDLHPAPIESSENGVGSSQLHANPNLTHLSSFSYFAIPTRIPAFCDFCKF